MEEAGEAARHSWCLGRLEPTRAEAEGHGGASVELWGLPQRTLSTQHSIITTGLDIGVYNVRLLWATVREDRVNALGGRGLSYC